MANLTPINANALGIYFQNANGAWVAWELGTRDGSGPTFSATPGEAQATRTFLCFGNQSSNAATWFVGDSDVNDGAGPTSRNITRRNPQPYPGNSKLIATSVRITGHKSTGQTGNGNTAASPLALGDLTLVNSYQMAKLEVTFTLELYRADIEDNLIGAGFHEYDRYVNTSETRASAELQQVPAGMMKWVSPTANTANSPHNQPVPFQSGVILPLEDFPVTWMRVPYNAWGDGTAIWQRVYGNGTSAPYLGTVNKTAIFGRPAGTLLLDSVRAIQKPCPIAQLGNTTGWEWQIEFGFKYDPNQWNQKYYFSPVPGNRTQNGWYLLGTGNATGAAYYSAGNVPDGYSIYNEREFANLFNVATLSPGP